MRLEKYQIQMILRLLIKEKDKCCKDGYDCEKCHLYESCEVVNLIKLLSKAA